jgi:putative pyruvate formate lyase activating enzyme
MGRAVSPDEFATLCLMLQEAGAENINLVTGTQFIPSIIEGLTIARAGGLNIPILWNSSGFENLLGLSLLAPWIDVYLPI